MFNSPVLDVTIGLVFIFLLYSLLATSINEAIASTFRLRALMLRNAIVDHMLSNTPTDSRLISIWKGFLSFFNVFPRVFKGAEKEKDKIGDQFFNHPMIRNYGSNKKFPLPSYLTANNFSNIIIDLLKKDFDKKQDSNSAPAQHEFSGAMKMKSIQQNPQYGQDVDKIQHLFDYYKEAHQQTSPMALMAPGKKSISKRNDFFLDPEVLDILDMLLKKSNYNLPEFQRLLESWFNDTMDRVSGWYKRQTQVILFCMGLVMAIMFNLDTIGITNKLSTNTDARKIIVAQAISYTEQHNTNTQPSANGPSTSTMPADIKPDTANVELKKKNSEIQALQKQLEDIKDFKKHEIDTINTLLALGWGDYGLVQDSARFFKKYFAKDPDKRCKGLPSISVHSTPEEKLEWLKMYYEQHGFWIKSCYVCSQVFSWRKFIGFLIFAFAISLGAPFWFDILNKVVKLRGTGTKETSSANNVATVSGGGSVSPIIINNHITEEAQG